MATTTPSDITASYRKRVRLSNVLIGVLAVLLAASIVATIYVARNHTDPVPNFNALQTGATVISGLLGGVAGRLRRKPDDE